MKAVAAKSRKEEKQNLEKAKKEKEAEDALWKDDDKQLAKKQARKDDVEKKRLEALEKKRERDALLAEEAEKEKGKQPKKFIPPPKITRAQIQEEVAKVKEATPADKKVQVVDEEPLPENLNRVQLEGETATTIDEALTVLKIHDNTPEVDKHPEKRMKAAFEDFEKVRLPELKVENPSLRLSQLKQMLRKEWQKHPSNPINKQLAELAKASS